MHLEPEVRYAVLKKAQFQRKNQAIEGVSVGYLASLELRFFKLL